MDTLVRDGVVAMLVAAAFGFVASSRLRCCGARPLATPAFLVALREAALGGDAVKIHAMLGSRDSPQCPPCAEADILHAAASKEENVEAVKELLDCGFSVEAPGSGRRVIHAVCDHRTGFEEMLQLLIDYNVDINTPDTDNYYNTALHLALYQENAPLARILMECDDLDPHPENSYGWRPVHLAAATNNVEILEGLYVRGAELEPINGRGSTPLHLACTSRALAAVQFLLTHGCKVTVEDNDHQTPLHLIMSTPKEENLHAKLEQIVSAMIKAGADVNARGLGGRTPLQCGLKKGHGKLSALLVIHGARADAADDQQITPLHMAASCGDSGMLDFLLNSRDDIDPNVRDCRGKTPLFVAAANGWPACISLLLRYKADINATDMSGATPLLTAVMNDHVKAAETLLHAGADCSIADASKNTPLLAGVQLGKPFSFLVEEMVNKHHANIHVADSEGRTALHWVAACGDTRLCTMLLELGASIEARVASDGSTALHWAAGEGERNSTEILINEGRIRGVDGWVDDKDLHGKTPLAWAIKDPAQIASNIIVAQFLVSRGARLDLCAEELSRLPPEHQVTLERAAEQYDDGDVKNQHTPFAGFTAFGYHSSDEG